MSAWSHHHHIDDVTIAFCLNNECDVSDYEPEPCEGVLWLNDQWTKCHFRLLWREDTLSVDEGSQAVMPLPLQLVSDVGHFDEALDPARRWMESRKQGRIEEVDSDA